MFNRYAAVSQRLKTRCLAVFCWFQFLDPWILLGFSKRLPVPSPHLGCQHAAEAHDLRVEAQQRHVQRRVFARPAMCHGAHGMSWRRRQGGTISSCDVFFTCFFYIQMGLFEWNMIRGFICVLHSEGLFEWKIK